MYYFKAYDNEACTRKELCVLKIMPKNYIIKI